MHASEQFYGKKLWKYSEIPKSRNHLAKFPWKWYNKDMFFSDKILNTMAHIGNSVCAV